MEIGDRLARAVMDLVPVARLLPSPDMGTQAQIRFRITEGQGGALVRLRRRLEDDKAMALGAKLLIEWPPEGWHETWVVAVHRDRAALLAAALERTVSYPLVLDAAARAQLAAVAPQLASRATLHIGNASMLLTSERELASLESAVSDLEAVDGTGPTRVELAAVLSSARTCPLERLR